MTRPQHVSVRSQVSLFQRVCQNLRSPLFGKFFPSINLNIKSIKDIYWNRDVTNDKKYYFYKSDFNNYKLLHARGLNSEASLIN